MNSNHRNSPWLFFLFVISILVTLSGCSSLVQDYSPDPIYAEVVFEATLPAAIPENTILQLEILDEVSCLNFNPIRYEMSLKGETTYYVRLPLPIDSVVKYRFILTTSPVMIERNSQGVDVRYRMAVINEPRVIRDTVISWDGNPQDRSFGQLSGYIVDAANNNPIPSIMVSIAGLTTYTAADGSFSIDGVPVGEQHLVAYSPSGEYQVFQQNALIAKDAQTPAIFSMQPVQYVNVTFNVKTPSNTIKGAPLRFLGNTLSLGNTFSELEAGCSVIASRAPIMIYHEDGSYSITLSLPVGLDLHYKYSLGDGFWNAERKQDGSLRTRQLVIPDHDVTVNDTITTWLVGDEDPLTVRVTVPQTTPTTDTISLQINPYVWMEPLPMWALGNNEWLLTIYNPVDILMNATYRYCRNDQCDISQGILSSTNTTTATITSANAITDQILIWNSYQPVSNLYDLRIENIQQQAGFVAGAEINSNFSHNGQPFLGLGFIDLAVDNFNWIYYDPTWTYDESNDSYYFDPRQDLFWNDHITNIFLAKASGLNIALYPQVHYLNSDAETLFSKNYQDYFWWHIWFDNYQQFILNFVHMASQNNTEAFIIGGDELLPFLKSGSYNLPSDMDVKLTSLIDTIRQQYSGQLGFALPANSDPANLPSWLDRFDFIYLQYSPQLSAQDDPSLNDLTQSAALALDSQIYNFYTSIQKPLILGLNVPSINGSAKGCVSFNINCDEYTELDPQLSADAGLTVDVQEQADVYLALLRMINQRSWISGVITRGYFPVLKINDYSASIHGKPAEEILTYWLDRINP